MCVTVYGWRPLVKAMEVTAGLMESNGSLPPGERLKVTCVLTICIPGSALYPMLGNKYGKTLPFFTLNLCVLLVRHKFSHYFLAIPLYFLTYLRWKTRKIFCICHCAMVDLLSMHIIFIYTCILLSR